MELEIPLEFEDVLFLERKNTLFPLTAEEQEHLRTARAVLAARWRREYEGSITLTASELGTALRSAFAAGKKTA